MGVGKAIIAERAMATHTIEEQLHGHPIEDTLTVDTLSAREATMRLMEMHLLHVHIILSQIIGEAVAIAAIAELRRIMVEARRIMEILMAQANMHHRQTHTINLMVSLIIQAPIVLEVMVEEATEAMVVTVVTEEVGPHTRKVCEVDHRRCLRIAELEVEVEEDIDDLIHIYYVLSLSCTLSFFIICTLA